MKADNTAESRTGEAEEAGAGSTRPEEAAAGSGRKSSGLGYAVRLFFTGRWKELFITPTLDPTLQFCRYIIVGGIATIVDWAVLYILEHAGLFYLAAAVFGFFFGLITNYALSVTMVFAASRKGMNKAKEFLTHALIGLIGLGLTLLIMYIGTDLLGMYFMVSKVIATLIVLVWNFLGRKLILYRN